MPERKKNAVPTLMGINGDAKELASLP